MGLRRLGCSIALLYAAAAAGCTSTNDAPAGATGSGGAATGSGGNSAGSGGATDSDASATGSGGATSSDASATGSGGTNGSGGATGSGGSPGGSGGTQGMVADPRGIFGHPDPATSYPTYAGFKLYMVEEFNQPIDLDRDPIWTWGDGALYEGMTHMTKENIAFEGGNMVINITQDPKPGAYSFSAADNVAAKPLSSGELRTIYNNFRYGRYEVRMKSPAATRGNYIHTMFTYRHPAYLLWREIDIEIQAAPTNAFITNIIHAAPGTRLWSAAIEESIRAYPAGGGGAMGIPAGLNTQSDFHTYAFEWLPTGVKWYVDGTLVRVKQDGVGPNRLPVPKESAKIMMNLWVFGSPALGGGSPADNVYPIRAQYDWFRYYKWESDAMYPCSPLPSCLPAADLELAKNNISDPLPDIRPARCTGVTGMQDAPCGN